MSKSRRITVRPGDDLWERVQKAAKEAGADTTTIVRQALETYFAGSAPNGNSPSKRPLPPPDEIDALVQKYGGWGSGDIRKERARLYCELLAVSFVCKRGFPRTPELVQGYIELRQLAEMFGITESCQTR